MVQLLVAQCPLNKRHGGLWEDRAIAWHPVAPQEKSADRDSSSLSARKTTRRNDGHVGSTLVRQCVRRLNAKRPTRRDDSAKTADRPKSSRCTSDRSLLARATDRIAPTP